MVNLLIFLFVFLLIAAALKLAGFFIKTGLFILTLPVIILAGVLLTTFFFLIFPFALIGSLLTVILAPLAFLTPLLPIILIGFGILLLARNR